MTATHTHTPREHPPIESIANMPATKLWVYVLGELDFLSTPEQKRIPAAVSAAMHELYRRLK